VSAGAAVRSRKSFGDPSSLLEDGRGAAEVDVGRRDFAEALVDAAVIV